MSASEFAEWAAFYRIEPWGDERADLRMGILAATIANIGRAFGGKRKGKALTPKDFMPKFDGKKESPVRSKVRQVMSDLGAKK